MLVGLVDQDRMVVQLVQQYLADAGHSFIEIVPDLLGTWITVPDLFVMDLNQKNQKGVRIYDELRTLPGLQATPCILISGRITAQNVLSMRSDSAAGLLIKPFTKDVFEDAVKRLLRQSIVQKIRRPKDEPEHDPQPESPEQIISSWREHLEAIQQHLQKVKSQLQSSPREIYEAQMKLLQDVPDHTLADRIDLRRMVLDATLLKSIILVLQDESLTKLLIEHFRQQGIFEVQCFERAMDAWPKIQAEGCDLLLIEWQSDLQGSLALYNHLRDQPERSRIPILVFCKEQEMKLILSLGEEDLRILPLQKPIPIQKVQEACVQLVSIAHCSDEVHDALDYALRQACSKNLLREIVKDLCERLPSLQLHLLGSAQQLVYEKRYQEAEMLGRILLERPEFQVGTATLLAKIYHLTQKSQAATEILLYVTAIAPDRIDRLLLSAEAELAMLKPKIADEYIARAQRIDPSHPRVQAASIISDFMADHKEELGSSPAGRNFASILNTIGVTLAKSGHAAEAERYYLSALVFVQDRMDQARLQYNLGLSYLRTHEQQKAQERFMEANRLADGNFPKAEAHLTGSLDKK